MTRVELKMAYGWFCEDCATENFSMPQKMELTEQDAEDIYRGRNAMDPWDQLPDDWRDFEVVARPDHVTCSVCGIVYETIDETRE